MSGNPWETVEGLDLDVDMSVLGTARAQLGDREDEQSFPDYGIEIYPIEVKVKGDDEWEDTGKRILFKNGEEVAVVSNQYKVLPNPRVVAAADRVADDLDAVPFDEFDGDWFVSMANNVYQNPERTRVHALYAWDDPVDVGDGDEVQFGFAVHNSIDKSLSFQVGLFTFRHACSNMVHMGVSGRGMGFDQRDVVTHASMTHKKSLDVELDALKARIKEVLTLAPEVEERYREWRRQVVRPDDVLELLDRRQVTDDLLPEWMAADESSVAASLEDARENEQLDGGELDRERKRKIAAEYIPDDQNVWDVYNDVTEAIWHDGETNDNTKRRKMKALHRTYEPHENLR